MRTALLTLLLAACTQPAIDLQLELPPDSSSFDLSCVTAVDVQPIGVGDRKDLDIALREEATQDAAPCVDIKTTPHSFADIESQMRGKIDLAIPLDGLAAVELRGRAGTCQDMPAYYESVFYGAAEYQKNRSSLAIPVHHNISCDQTTQYTIRPVDLVQTIQSKTCTAPAAANTQVFSADVRPTELSGDYSPIILEEGSGFGQPAMGTATINSFKGSYAGTCPAAEWNDGTDFASSCINPDAPTACANAGEIELPIVPYAYANNSIDPAQGAYSGLVIGAVWSKTGTPGPVQGATITLDAGSDAVVEYGTGGASAFTPLPEATATDASGMFEIYTNQVTGITVTAPGHGTQTLYVGAGPEAVGGALVVLQ